MMKGQITKKVKPMTDKQAKALAKDFNMGLERSNDSKKGSQTAKKKGK